MTVWVVSQISRSMSSTERVKALFPSGKNKTGATNNMLPTFELTQLKDKEKEALFYLVSGHDVFVNVSTGFGKSLIHQLAPFVVSEKRREESLCHCVGNFSFDFINQRLAELSSKEWDKGIFYRKWIRRRQF